MRRPIRSERPARGSGGAVGSSAPCRAEGSSWRPRRTAWPWAVYALVAAPVPPLLVGDRPDDADAVTAGPAGVYGKEAPTPNPSSAHGKGVGGRASAMRAA